MMPGRRRSSNPEQLEAEPDIPDFRTSSDGRVAASEEGCWALPTALRLCFGFITVDVVVLSNLLQSDRKQAKVRV